MNVRVIRLLSFRKLWNMFLVSGSFVLARIIRRPFHRGMPLSISIEPTTSCNLRCPECPSGLRAFTRPTGMLDPVFFEKTLDQFRGTLIAINFYFQGEPFLNRNLMQMIAAAAQRNIFTSTSTNAHFLDEETARKTVESGLHRLIVSIDGTTQETYQQYRVGGKLERVLDGTRRVLAWKRKLQSSTPEVIFQFLVVRPNEHQTEEAIQLARELGVNEVRFKTAQVYDFEQGNPLIPTRDQYSRYRRRKDGTWALKNKLENHCWRMWQGCVITWDGFVVPCCFDKDAQHRLGKVGQQSFREIWKSRSYRDFRGAVLSARQEIDICRNCTEGTKVWA